MLALIGDLFMLFGQNQTGFFPVFAAFLLAGQGPLGFLELRFGFAQTVRVGMLERFISIVCGDGEVGKTQVNADFVFRRKPYRRFLFHQDGNEIMAGLVHRNGARLDQALEIPMLLDFDEPDLRQFDFPVFDADVPALVVGRVGRFRFVLGFEFRKTDGFVPEEVLVGPVQVLVGVRQGQIVHLFQEREFLFEGRIGSRLDASQQFLVVFVCFVGCFPVGQHLVEDESCGTETIGEVDFLFLVGVQTELVGFQHDTHLFGFIIHLRTGVRQRGRPCCLTHD